MKHHLVSRSTLSSTSRRATGIILLHGPLVPLTDTRASGALARIALNLVQVFQILSLIPFFAFYVVVVVSPGAAACSHS